MKFLTLVRHGSLSPELDGRYIGSTEAALSSRGLHEAEAIGKFLKTSGCGKLFASPQLRTRQTVTVAGLEDQATWDDRLREMDFGDCEAMTFAEIAAQWPYLSDGWSSANVDFSFPNGGNVGDFNARIADFYRELQASEHEVVTLFTHGGVINELLVLALKIQPESIWQYRIVRGSVSILEYLDPEHARLVLLNHQPFRFFKGLLPWAR